MDTTRTGRRRWALAATAALAAALVGCGTGGFHLRGSQEIVYKRIALSAIVERSAKPESAMRR